MKILAIRVGRAGDIVMVTPALRAILDKWPDAELHVVTSPDGKRVLKGFHERLSRLIIYQRKGLKGLLEKNRVRKEINQTSYDKVFCFELNPGFLKLVEQQKAELEQITEAATVTNYARRCLQVVCDDTEINNRWLYLPVTDEARSLAKQQLQDKDITDDDFVVGLHPSFSALRKFSFRNRDTRNQKGWPAENFAALARMLSNYGQTCKKRVYVVMDLVPEDRELGEKIVQLSDNKAVLFIPPLNFERYKALLQRMDLLVSPDTGPMHIAAAVGTRLVALFAGHDPRDCGPYVPDEQFTVLRAEDMAEPDQGLAALKPETVFEVCKKYLP